MPPKNLIRLFLVPVLLILALLGVRESRAGSLTIAPGNICFIPGLYHDLLNRNPSSSEIASGQAYLAGNTRAQYAATFLAGTEYQTNLIQGWYRRFLGRPASSSEIADRLSYFGSGGTDEGVIADIVSSDEYFHLPRVGATNSGYITALFQDLLGRTPSSAELIYWLGQMGGGLTRLQLAQKILSSDEYRVILIQSWYRKYLGRSPSNDEIGAAIGIFNSSGTDEQIITIIVGSDEYFNRSGICTMFLPLVTR